MGGLRHAKKDSHNTLRHNESFRGYADYMETSDFRQGIKQVTDIAEERHKVIVCAEVLWWRCHRSMIADYLKAEGWTVIHIRDSQHCEEHPSTAVASLVTGK